MKQTRYKPSNKDRDKAIAHLLGKIQGLEELINAQMKAFDLYLKFDNKTDKFNEFYIKEMEEMLEEQRPKSGDGQTLVENQEDAG